MKKLYKSKCALCGKKLPMLNFLMPTGTAVCSHCAKELYIAFGALKAMAEQEATESNN